MNTRTDQIGDQTARATGTSVRTIEYAEYVDKILGAWLGKSIGGTIGGPLECHKLQMDFTVANCWPTEIIPNDDLDIQVVWFEALLERGPYLNSRILAEYWRDRCWYNFCEYDVFLYNAQRGIAPPVSGWFNNRFFRESMGCPIRSEIWGVVCPGNPALAAEYARMDGELDHWDISVHAEQVLAAAAAHAFFAETVEECLEVGLAQIPAESRIVRVMNEVRELCERMEDWSDVRRAIVRRWGHRDSSNVLVNQAITYAALFLGAGDFDRTVLTAVNCGWDTDCTAASAGALVGILRGAAALPAIWRERVGDRLNCFVDIKHRDALFTEFADKTAKIGLEVMLTRNPRVEILNAPEIPEPRHESIEHVELDVEYADQPVLRAGAPTAVCAVVRNNTDQPIRGELSISPPTHLSASPAETTVELAPNATQTVEYTITQDPDNHPVIHDTNIMQVRFTSPDAEAQCTFGLGGARRWLVYGPYWDVYDTTAHDECPFHNDTLMKNPAHVDGCLYSAYHQYARLDRAYLDETALLAGPLPDENPFVLEAGEDLLDETQLGAHIGESCMYLTREIVSPGDTQIVLNLGSTGPYWIAVNGRQVCRHDGVQPWSPMDRFAVVDLREGVNRMVVKLVRLTDECKFYLAIRRTDMPARHSKGVSNFHDGLGCRIESMPDLSD